MAHVPPSGPRSALLDAFSWLAYAFPSSGLPAPDNTAYGQQRHSATVVKATANWPRKAVSPMALLPNRSWPRRSIPPIVCPCCSQTAHSGRWRRYTRVCRARWLACCTAQSIACWRRARAVKRCTSPSAPPLVPAAMSWVRIASRRCSSETICRRCRGHDSSQPIRTPSAHKRRHIIRAYGLTYRSWRAAYFSSEASRRRRLSGSMCVRIAWRRPDRAIAITRTLTAVTLRAFPGSARCRERLHFPVQREHQ